MIPYVKRKVQAGTVIVFSGVIPTQVLVERSNPFLLARSLGASVKSLVDGIWWRPDFGQPRLMMLGSTSGEDSLLKRDSGFYTGHTSWIQTYSFSETASWSRHNRLVPDNILMVIFTNFSFVIDPEFD